MNQELKNSIQKTLCYFDQFSYPLTEQELFNFLWQPPTVSWAVFLGTLGEMVAEKTIEQQNLFYFLPGRANLVSARARCFLLREKKLRLARKLGRMLAAVPFIQGVFVCNTVASGWPQINSDIDLFVVAKPGRLWFARSVFTALTSLLNRRRHGTVIADHLCLSFYATPPAFNLNSVRITTPDIYLVYWLQALIPMYADPKVLPDLLTANSWIKEYVPNFESRPLFQRTVLAPFGLNFFKKTTERLLADRFGNWVEKVAKRYQHRRIDRQAHQAPPHVVISDSMLKFHEADRREEYQNIWLEKCKQSGLV